MSYRADEDGDIWDDETSTVYDPAIIAGYLTHIREMCRTFVRLDADAGHRGLTHRAWLAQSVLNILDGNIDEQIIHELTQSGSAPQPQEDTMSEQYRCCTCNHEGSVWAISCGDWRTCRNFANAKAKGTLPNPFPAIGGGPTEADRAPDQHVTVPIDVDSTGQVIGITPSGVYPLGEIGRRNQ